MPKATSKPEGSSPAHPERRGLLKPATEQSESQMPSQGDHIRMLIELLQPTGPDLARRWLAALLIVPREDRRGVVESVEERITSMYAKADGAAPGHADEPREIDVVHPPVQHDGYVEEVRTTYSATEKPAEIPAASSEPGSIGKTGGKTGTKTGGEKPARARKPGKAG